MWNSNELFHKNFINNDKHTHELKDHSYTKMIIEVLIRRKNDDFDIVSIL